MLKELTALGFDFGLKFIGIAVGQTLTATAHPLSQLHAKKGEPNWSELDALIKEWRPNILVIGIPLNMDGTEQPMTTYAKNFAENLNKRYQLPIQYIDERLSTVEAREYLFKEKGYRALQKKTIDAKAAQIILETWLQQYANTR